MMDKKFMSNHFSDEYTLGPSEDFDEIKVDYVVGLETLLREYLNKGDYSSAEYGEDLRRRALEHLNE